jgi:hypothetical protein
LMSMGLGGIECYSSYHDRVTTGYFLEWCRSHALLVTGGSDSHGGFVGREMGKPLVHLSALELGELLDTIQHQLDCIQLPPDQLIAQPSDSLHQAAHRPATSRRLA